MAGSAACDSAPPELERARYRALAVSGIPVGNAPVSQALLLTFQVPPPEKRDPPNLANTSSQNKTDNLVDKLPYQTYLSAAPFPRDPVSAFRLTLIPSHDKT